MVFKFQIDQQCASEILQKVKIRLYTVPNNEDTHVRRYGLPLTIQICVDLHVVDTDDRRFKRV